MKVPAQPPSIEPIEQKGTQGIPESIDSLFRFRQSADLGELESVQIAPAPETFIAYSLQQYYHTDNLFLTERLRQSANSWAGTFGAGWVPYSTYSWTPRLTVSGTLVRFDRASRADYNDEAVGFENTLGLTKDNLLQWTFSASALRAVGERTGLGEFYRRVEVANALNWLVPLDHRGRWGLHLSPAASWRSAHPSFEDRFDFSAFGSLLWIPKATLAIEPFVEAGYSFYPNDSPSLLDRRDVHVRSGSNLNLRINSSAFVSLSAYWFGNYSSARGADYQILPSIAIDLQVGF